MSQLHFVHETKPGSSLDSDQIRALRSHVRKVNLERSTQKSTRRLENFRSLTVTDFAQGGRRVKAGRRKSFPPSGVNQDNTINIEGGPSHVRGSQSRSVSPINDDIPTRAFWCLSYSQPDSLCENNRRQYTNAQRSRPANAFFDSDEQHPYASQVSRAVGIDEARIEYLLSSCAFQAAAEPLFTKSHVHANPTTPSVFPKCLTDSSFLYALLYALLHIQQNYHASNETLLLKSKAIEYLREDLQRDDPIIRALSVGTILLLSGVARHCGELAESAAHSEGLYKLLKFCHANGGPLQPDVLRAVFWQHHLGTALVGNQRDIVQEDFLFGVDQSTDFSTPVSPDLPPGFLSHKDVICGHVRSCIRAVVYLQRLLADQNTDRARIDDLQASIESRLVFNEEKCKQLGLIAECGRLAAYLVCYMTVTSTYRSAFVALRLAEKLLAYLETTSDRAMWVGHRDLFLWLLLVGASTVAGGEICFASMLQAAYQNLLNKIIEETKGWTDLSDRSRTLHSALKEFIYAPSWIDQRTVVPNWMELEHAVLSIGLEDVDELVDVK